MVRLPGRIKAQSLFLMWNSISKLQDELASPWFWGTGIIVSLYYEAPATALACFAMGCGIHARVLLTLTLFPRLAHL
jgi:hypothetical protein